MVGLVGGFRVPPGNVVSSLSLGLEGDSFLVPIVDGRRYSVHGHDAAHQGGWDSCGEISNQDIGIRDVGKGDVVFEHRNIFHQRGGIQVILRILLHTFGG